MNTTPPLTKAQDSTLAADSAKAAAKKLRKSKAKAEKAAQKADAKVISDSIHAAKTAPDSAPDSAKASAKPLAPTLPAATVAVPDSSSDTSKAVAQPAPTASASTTDSIPAPTVEVAAQTTLETKASEPKREPQDLRLFNDPALIAKEYGFGILGSIVAGALGFYIGSGIETAIEGESQAHQGTLGFTGIRYDNFYGAWYGGATGMVMGSALTTYFVGQTDEEDGGLLLTLAGTAAAAGGAFYIAHLMGANDEIDWKPFIPLLALPSIGGTFGFNVSRWFSDHAREKTVGGQASIRMHTPTLAWGRDAAGDRVEFRALNLTF
ncbi:MAG: hypothetical protein ABIQ80_07235 [Fibrobacteria bacterium]